MIEPGGQTELPVNKDSWLLGISAGSSILRHGTPVTRAHQGLQARHHSPCADCKEVGANSWVTWSKTLLLDAWIPEKPSPQRLIVIQQQQKSAVVGQVECINPFLLRLVSLEHDVLGLMGLNETLVMGWSLLIPSLPVSKWSNPFVSTSEICLSDFIATAPDLTAFIVSYPAYDKTSWPPSLLQYGNLCHCSHTLFSISHDSSQDMQGLF